MTLHPIPSEFPYIWGKFYFLFYQYRVSVWSHHPVTLSLYCTDTCSRFCPPYRPWLVLPLPLSKDIVVVDELVPVLFPFPFLAPSYLVLVLVLCPFVLSSRLCTVLIIFVFRFLSLLFFLLFTHLVMSCRLCTLLVFVFFSYLCRCPCSLPAFSWPVVFALSLYLYFFYNFFHWPCSLPVLSYRPCRLYPILIFVFVFLSLSVSLFFTRHALSCRLSLSLYECFFSYLSQCHCSLPVIPCPVVFAFSIYFCFIQYLCYCSRS